MPIEIQWTQEFAHPILINDGYTQYPIGGSAGKLCMDISIIWNFCFFIILIKDLIVSLVFVTSNVIRSYLY